MHAGRRRRGAGDGRRAGSGAHGSHASALGRCGTVAGGAARGCSGHTVAERVDSSGRKLAVIDGLTVPLGGMVGGARLVRITETEVSLKTGNETEVLKLFPGIDKKPSGRGVARARQVSPGTKAPRNGESR